MLKDCGKAVRFVWLDRTVLQPLPPSTSRNATVPPVPSTASQYFVPDVMAPRPLRVAVVHAPAFGEATVALPSRLPGVAVRVRIEAKVNPVAVLAESTYKEIEPTVPDADAVYVQACASLDPLLSVVLCTFLAPTEGPRAYAYVKSSFY